MLYEKVSKSDKDIVFVYTTCPSIEEAREIGFSAIDKKLAVSADYWIMNSMYPWNNVIQDGEQYMLMFATQKGLSDTLTKYIEEEHSYSVPVVITCDTIMTNQPYHFWVDTILSSKKEYTTATEEELKKQTEKGYYYERLK